MIQHELNYPRPQLVRKQWIDLNGEWDFTFDDEHIGCSQNYAGGFTAQRTITVPFAYETALSGIHDETPHDCVWYQQSVTLTKKTGHRILLHFEGADYETAVYINGHFAGRHQGAYERFSFDITELVRDGENRIVVCCEDSFSIEQPRGKQRWQKESYACWYVQTTGIWKTVWIEMVPETYVESLKLTPDLEHASLQIEAIVRTPETPIGAEKCDRPGDLQLSAEVSLKGIRSR